MDFELFTNQMKLLRGWDFQKAKSVWQELKDSGAETDRNGTKEYPERLAIPANLIGEEGNLKKHVNFEEKRVDTGNKAKIFSAEDKM
eukprot:4394186-Karenia_brevis.AAC.1